MTFWRFRRWVFQSAHIFGRPAGALEVFPENSIILMSACKRRAPGEAKMIILATECRQVALGHALALLCDLYHIGPRDLAIFGRPPRRFKRVILGRGVSQNMWFLLLLHNTPWGPGEKITWLSGWPKNIELRWFLRNFFDLCENFSKLVRIDALMYLLHPDPENTPKIQQNETLTVFLNLWFLRIVNLYSKVPCGPFS